MADNYRFAESDSLLCYHGPILYEAKCLERRKTSDGKIQYYIHYKGWNNKWDEWVDDNRVLTVNIENMKKMASLKELLNATPKKPIAELKRGMNESDSDISSESSDEIEKDEESSSDNTFIVSAPVVRRIPVIIIPLIIKKRLSYDYTMMNCTKKTLIFPAKQTVEFLIRSYVCSKSNTVMPIFRERATIFGLTLIQYFNVLIHTKLLYPRERRSHVSKKAAIELKNRINNGKITHISFGNFLFPKRIWHYVFSPTYLLRLLPLLPSLLLSTNTYNDNQLNVTVEHIHDFLKFIEDNFDEYFFATDYN